MYAKNYDLETMSYLFVLVDCERSVGVIWTVTHVIKDSFIGNAKAKHVRTHKIDILQLLPLETDGCGRNIQQDRKVISVM
jgi:hypothetical protein